MNENDTDTARPALTAAALRAMTARDFAALGARHVAYMKPALRDGARIIAIHAADGTPIGAAPTDALAAAAIRQHEMEPLWLH